MAHTGQRLGVAGSQLELVFGVPLGEHPVLVPGSHDLGAFFQRRAGGQAHSVDPPPLQKGLCGQMSIVDAKCFRACDKTAARSIPAAHQAKTDAEFAVFEEQNTGFKSTIAANEDGRNPSVFRCIGSDEVFRVGGEVVLLAAVQAESTNFGQAGEQLSLSDKDFRGAFSAFKCDCGKSSGERRKGVQNAIGSGQLGGAQFTSPVSKRIGGGPKKPEIETNCQ